ncbi:MAG: polysaccharide export protein [Deltaproteobacteria bacterium]|jgi:polysaccharide export outer membrane protein|nr:polysaccharide export protein [Deltaproteobacteria bacterium]
MKKVRFFIGLLFLVVSFGTGLAFPQEGETSEDYLVHPADVLEISIYDEKELTRKLIVRPDGKISFPLIGDIRVAGHSPTEVKAIIDKKVSAFIPEASSAVIVDQLGSLEYYVVGQVARPGMFNVASSLTVLQALSLAGGLKTYADQDSIIIIRGHGKDAKKIPFDYSRVKKGKHLEQNILLERGDVVLVP